LFAYAALISIYYLAQGRNKEKLVKVSVYR